MPSSRTGQQNDYVRVAPSPDGADPVDALSEILLASGLPRGGPSTGFVKLKPLPDSASVSDAEWERRAEAAEVEALPALRAAGEKWTTAITSLTGIFSVIVLVKGPEDVTKIEGDIGDVLPGTGMVTIAWEHVVIALLALAIAAGVFAILRAARAAYGMPSRFTQPSGRALRQRQRSEVIRSRRALKSSIRAAIGAVAALGLAIGVTWLETPDSPASGNLLVVRDDGSAVCGRLQEQSGEQLTVRKQGSGDMSVPLARIRTAAAVSDCPAD